jgi:hypothetical protein
LITGFGAPVDPFMLDAALFNGGDGIIELFSDHRTGLRLAVGHAKFTAPNTLTETPAPEPVGRPSSRRSPQPAPRPRRGGIHHNTVDLSPQRRLDIPDHRHRRRRPYLHRDQRHPLRRNPRQRTRDRRPPRSLSASSRASPSACASASTCADPRPRNATLAAQPCC